MVDPVTVQVLRNKVAGLVEEYRAEVGQPRP